MKAIFGNAALIFSSARTAGRTSSLRKRACRSDIVSYSSPRSLPLPSFPPFWTAMAMKAGRLRLGSLEIVRLSRALRTSPRWLGPSNITRIGALVPSL